MNCRIIAIVLIGIISGLASDAFAADEPYELRVYRAKVKLRAGDPARDFVLLKAVFPIGLVPNQYDPRWDGISLSLGGEKVLAVPPVDDRSKLTRKLGRGWIYREKKSADRSGVRRFRLNVGGGELFFKAKKLDLAGLATSGPDGVTVRLVLGATVMEDEIDFSTNAKGNCWNFSGDAGFVPLPGPPGGGGGGGGGGGNPPPPANLTFAELLSGGFSAITTAKTVVVRNATEYSVLWAQHSPPMPPGVGAPDMAPPTVDFTNKMLVAVFLGTRPSAGYSVKVTSVEPSGTGALVKVEETQPGTTCVVASVITSPFVFITMTKVSGSVVFEHKVTVKNCP